MVSWHPNPNGPNTPSTDLFLGLSQHEDLVEILSAGEVTADRKFLLQVGTPSFTQTQEKALQESQAPNGRQQYSKFKGAL